MAAVNGLELKTPEECGYSSVTKDGTRIHTLLLKNGKPFRFIHAPPRERYIFDFGRYACRNPQAQNPPTLSP